jgi:hypothetical protein
MIASRHSSQFLFGRSDMKKIGRESPAFSPPSSFPFEQLSDSTMTKIHSFDLISSVQVLSPYIVLQNSRLVNRSVAWNVITTIPV